MENERYLGDGLYASFDGWQIRLRAPRADGDHVVYLEPSVWNALLDYAKHCYARADAAAATPAMEPTPATDGMDGSPLE